MTEHSKYDVELTTVNGSERFGFMLDFAADTTDADLAESEESNATTVTQQNAAGDYSWKDQRAMPGVAINDFRAGQGQKILDRQDSVANAFLAGRFLDCEKEGEFSLAPSLLTAPSPDIEDVLIEANGQIFAAFNPGSPSDQVRRLERYTCTLSVDMDTDDTAPTVSDVYLWPLDSPPVAATITIGDWWYDPDAREIVKVTDDSPLTVERIAGWFDNDDASQTPVAHVAGTVWQCYGWRPIAFATTAPSEHCRAMAWDGARLWAAFSDTSSDGELWYYPDGDGKFAAALITGIDGICNLAFGMGRLYYAAEGSDGTVAGFINRDVAGTGYEATQLSADAVVGEAWSTDHWEPTMRNLISPQAQSHGLVLSDTWAYWLVGGGRTSTLYRVQAPLGFELVRVFPKGFRATCLESAFGNIYVGGYRSHSDGTSEGIVYIVSGETSERVMTLDDASLDNQVKGLTVVGDLVYVLTNTQVYAFNIKTSGYWHVMDVPPSNPDTAIAPFDPMDWTEFEFTTGEPSAEFPTAWTKNANSATEPVMSIETSDTETYLQAFGGNTQYRRYRYDTQVTGDDVSLLIDLARITLPLRGPVPDDGFVRSGKRRMAEIILQNGTNEARFRIRAAQDGDYWYPEYAIGTYEKSKLRWRYKSYFRESDEPPRGFMGNGHLIMCSLSAEGAVLSHNGTQRFSTLAENLKATTGDYVYFSMGTPLRGDTQVWSTTLKRWVDEDTTSVNTSNKFVCRIDKVSVTFNVTQPLIFAQTPTGTGACAELDGDVFFPVAGDASLDEGFLCFTRYGERYAKDSGAYLVTSDSYQGMGTAKKFYRRIEIAYPALLDGQWIDANAYIDDTPPGSNVALDPSIVGEVGEDETRPSALTMKAIDKNGIKARVRVDLYDTVHKRPPEDILKVESIGIRFMPASSAIKHVYTFGCYDHIVTRDGSKYDVDAAEAIDFIKRLKRTGEIVTITDDHETYKATIDAYVIMYRKADEKPVSERQAQVQVTAKVIDE